MCPPSCPPPKVPTRSPPNPPPLLLSTTLPAPSQVFSVHGLGLAACASANTPRPSDPGRTPRGGAGGPPSRLWSEGAAPQLWVGGRTAAVSAPRPIRPLSTLGVGGAGSWASGEGGPVQAGAGSGWAQAGSGGGVSGYSPAGGRGRPAVWASSPVSRRAGRI